MGFITKFKSSARIFAGLGPAYVQGQSSHGPAQLDEIELSYLDPYEGDVVSSVVEVMIERHMEQLRLEIVGMAPGRP